MIVRIAAGYVGRECSTNSRDDSQDSCRICRHRGNVDIAIDIKGKLCVRMDTQFIQFNTEI
jgi:hypothetical protein